VGLLPQTFIDDLRTRADIVQVVQDYVPLKKSGSTWKGLCPFHGEKMPSFHVNPDKGFFYCFGCQTGGDVFKFVELQEKYRDKGFHVVGVSVDDPPEALTPFARQFKINYPLVVGQDREDVQNAFGPIYAVPTTVIIGRGGKVCVKHIGPVTKEQFESEIKALL